MNKWMVFLIAILVVVWPLETLPGSWNAQADTPSGSSASLKPFLGRWDLSIQAPRGELPSWIDVSEQQGRVKVVMVGLTDHATELKQVDFKNGELEFLSPQGEEGFNDDTLFKAKLINGLLVGTTSTPKGAFWNWSGRRAPSLRRTSPPKWGKPITLFNGKDLSGWRFRDATQSAIWKVEDATLVKDGHGPDLITTSKFGDFKLHLEFNCGPKANSGVYLRGRYEVQIETDSAEEPPSHHTGGVYGFLDPTPELPRQANVWQTFDITFVGRTVTVVQNGQTVINHQEIPGLTGGALDSHEGSPGPIYLQGSEEGRVAFRNMVITPAE